MLETLISSKTRMKILLKFFLNPDCTSYLRGLAEEFGESTNSVRLELNRFEDAGMLMSESAGNKKIYKANSKHPFFQNIQSLVFKHYGIDKIVESIINKLGRVSKIYLTGDYAVGKDSGILDFVIVGEIDKVYLINITTKAEKLIKRKVRFLIYNTGEWEGSKVLQSKHLLLWDNLDAIV